MRTNRFAVLVAGLLAAAGVQVVATPAEAIPGRVRVVATSANNNAAFKQVNPVCPSGTRVVGGGGWAFDNDANKVRLIRLEPLSSTQSSYFVQAEAEIGFTGNWWLEGYAICATTPAGHQIVQATSTAASSTFVSKFVDCPTGKKLLGTGATILSGNHEVGLQRIGADSGLTRSLVTAREDATGFAGNWTLTAYGVCANPVAGANLKTFQTSGSVANSSCTSGSVHTVGGGGPFFDAGPVFLMKLFPSSNGSSIGSAMSGTPSHGITEVNAICAP
ncbi:hypothetical protein [Actinoplanes sp. NPDC026670]|uniref:hypothetical protein n=1 Tax=Actinoplanes sp. NPDC026670 TaxID=3154700 RepID=UPI003405D4E2